jgi:uncharacterized protein YegJ (DUF2314 family)
MRHASVTAESVVRRAFACVLACGLFGLFAAPIAGCGDPEGHVIAFEQDDEQMNDAIERARSTLDEFVLALRNPPPGATGFAIKKAFEQEHIWVGAVEVSGDGFVGLIANHPVHVDLSFRDRVRVERDEISDWTYRLADGTYVGGYTIRVVDERMSADERQEHFGGEASFSDP